MGGSFYFILTNNTLLFLSLTYLVSKIPLRQI